MRCVPTGNKIGNQGATELAGALRVNGSLEKLYLGCKAASNPWKALQAPSHPFEYVPPVESSRGLYVSLQGTKSVLRGRQSSRGP